jgi:uncharacterized secreted protein with C-terminal beta-propeller domain
VVGELEIPGFSSYLHPIGDGLVIGVGQDADEDGRTQGTKVSLFDVTDLAAPAEVATWMLPNSGSTVEWDHHAFLWWPATKLAVLPMESDAFSGAAAFRVGRASGIAALGRISHPAGSGSWTPPVSRAVVVGDRLFTVSPLGVKANPLDGLADRGWAAFPAPPEPPCCKEGPIPLPMPMR